MITPRLHVRYALNDDLIFRAAGGKGYRTSNIFTEYASAFASSRNIEIKKTVDFGYGLEQEKAWNYGVNLTYYFLWNYREASFSLDLYRTDFESVLIADLDTDPQKIIFSTEKNAAYSNSLQAELNIKPLENVDLRLAYRLLDVKQRINNQNLDKLFTAKHRALINLGYTTPRENEDEWQYLFDATLQWFGPKRLPAAFNNADGSVRPVEYQIPKKSPGFALLNAQVTVNFSPQLSFYLGGENLLDYKQQNPIIDSGNPFGQYFDASIIWAPISGRMVYAGFRVGI
jgi:outer membrane receptor protein involved in Fe transport